jgi:hypothetical protein
VAGSRELGAVEPRGNHRFQPVSVGQCRTCASEHRAEIEEMWISRIAPVAIVRSLPDGSGITARNVVEHVSRRHLPIDRAAVADHVRYRSAELQGWISELATESRKTEINKALLTLAAGTMQLQDGQWQVKGHEVIAAMKLLAEHDDHEQEVGRVEARAQRDDDERMSQLDELFVIVGMVCGEEKLGEVIQYAACRSPLSDVLLDRRLAHVHDDCCRPDYYDINLLDDPEVGRPAPSVRAASRRKVEPNARPARKTRSAYLRRSVSV